MTGDSRQQRRKLERERRKIGERGLFRGLAVKPSRAEVVGVAEIIREKLLEAGNDRRASEAAGIAQSLGERSLRANPAEARIACSKGCSYCCHGFVGAVPPEAFRIAEAVRAGHAGSLDAEAVRARAQPLIGLEPSARVGRKLPCPLLVDGACSVYAVRPLVCRQTTSLSLPDCIEEFEGTDPEGRIEISSVHLAHASNAHVALLGAMLAVGLPGEAYELGALLDVVLAEPDCERRWLGGEKVFSGLTSTVRRQPQFDFVARRVADDLTG
jgi:Fe-S-cluster containining protein